MSISPGKTTTRCGRSGEPPEAAGETTAVPPARIARLHPSGGPAVNVDYIIVGAGSAGCVLASRLTEDPRVSVLLPEAGGRDTNPWLHLPVGSKQTLGHGKATDKESVV